MGLQLIVGRAGSGKTEYCIREIRERLLSGDGKEEYVLLTPEQATFANEKRILTALGNTAGLQVKTLSFRRFVHWVLQEAGGGLWPSLDTVGKSLVLRCILEKQKRELTAFRRVWDKKGFVRQLSDLMDELRTYQVDQDAMLACVQERISESDPTSDLASKLQDIHRVYAAYESFLAQGWLDAAGELALLCEKLPLWPRLQNVHFWLDGFHGFTPAEFSVIRCLLDAGRPVKVTLNLPCGEEARKHEEDELFYPTWETAESLRQMCRKVGHDLEQTIHLGVPSVARFAGSQDLARLESAFAGQQSEKEAHRSEGRSIRLAACGDVRQEVERLAIEILEAAREDKLRYNEMAVLLRRPQDYEDLIHAILPAYGIPYFFDGPKPLRYHPLIALLRELAVILHDQWNTGTLMAYMKTGLAGLTDNQGYALENYCLAHGIRRMHWESRRPWRFTSPEEPEHERIDLYMENLRKKLWQPVEALRRSLTEAHDVQDIVAAVYEHLVSLKAEEACSRMANEALKRGEPETAQLHQRAWRELMKLFDQTVTFLTPTENIGGTAVPGAAVREIADPRLVASVWESALEAIEMAALPPALDQVAICSMDRSRSPMAAKVWILGANEGVLPARIQEDSLLSAEERQWIAQRHIALAPDSRRRMFSEAYLIYIALTRASGSLHISCARADAQGRNQAPSAVFEQIRRLFPGLSIEEAEPDVTRRLTRPAPGIQLLGMALQNSNAGNMAGTLGIYAEADQNAETGQDAATRQDAEAGQDAEACQSTETGQNAEAGQDAAESLWRYVFRWYSHRREYSRDLERLKLAFDLAPLGQPLPAALAERIFGRLIKTSITRLEQYHACPFAHYLAYGLSLAPREEYEIQPPEIGNFFHDSLEALMEEVHTQGLTLSALSREELKGLVEIIAERQLEKKDHQIFLTTAWYRSLSDNLLRILLRTADVMAWQEGQSHFRTHVLEADFGFDRPESYPPISLSLGADRHILLRGRIDRIDQAMHAPTQTNYIRVVDYKSGQIDLSLHEVYHGLKLQLVLYMEAALAAHPGTKPAGLFYYQVHDPVLTAANLPEARNEQWREEKKIKAQPLRGYVLRDREIVELMDRDYVSSLFLPVSVLQSGDFGKRSKLLDAGAFRLIGDHARQKLIRAGQRIMQGDISLAPYQQGKKTACDYCPYTSVCRFDTAVPGHRYRYLPSLPDEVVLDRLAGEEAGI